MRGLVVLLALGVAMLGVSASASAQDTFARAQRLRDRGEDLAAARLLEARRQGDPSPRVSAELGLAYQGAGRLASAEYHLSEALEARSDPWVAEHHAGLEAAHRFVVASLGWVTATCTPAADVRVVGDGAAVSCGEPLRVPAGGADVEVRALGHRSVQRRVDVSAGDETSFEVSLEPFECPRIGMQHMGGDDGRCCWPEQELIGGACVGPSECDAGDDACFEITAPVEAPRRLASFHISLLGGVAGFGRTDGSLFRPGVPAQRDAIGLGPRFELRAGIKLFALIGLDLTVGGALQEAGGWLDCGPAGASCEGRSSSLWTVDFGAMITAHTDPPRIGGNVDFHLGLGIRPWVNVFFDDDGEGSQLTATVVPAELGASIYFTDFLSLDLIGQAELWIPWEHCGTSGGASYCLGSDALDAEWALSGLGGLTLHAE